MAKEKVKKEVNEKKYEDKYERKHQGPSHGDAVYGLGIIGAAFYYIPHAHTFQEGFIGLLKALFWPALFVYKMVELLKI